MNSSELRHGMKVIVLTNTGTIIDTATVYSPERKSGERVQIQRENKSHTTWIHPANLRPIPSEYKR